MEFGILFFLGALALGVGVGYFLAWPTTLIIAAAITLFFLWTVVSTSKMQGSGEAKLAAGMAFLLIIPAFAAFLLGAVGTCLIVYWGPISDGLANLWGSIGGYIVR